MACLPTRQTILTGSPDVQDITAMVGKAWVAFLVNVPLFLPEYNTYATIRYPLVLVIDERYQRLRDLWWRSHLQSA